MAFTSKHNSYFSFKILGNSYVDLIIRLIGLIFIFQFSRIIFYLANLDFFGKLSFSDFILILKGGLFFDIVSIIYLNIIWILLYIIPSPTRLKSFFIRFLNIIFFIVNALGLLFNAIDTTYFQFNLRRTTYNSLFELSDILNFWTLLPSYLLNYWLSWTSWFFLLIPLWYLLKCTNSPKFKQGFHAQVDWFIVLLFIIVAGLRGGNLRHSTRPIGLNNAGEYVKSQNNVAIVLNTPFTVFKTIGSESLTKITYFKNPKTLNSNFDPICQPDTSQNSVFKKYNVVLLIIESYSEEASELNNKNHKSGGFTPFLDSLREQSFYSSKSISNGKKSIEALPSVLCGIPSLKSPYVLSEFSSNTLTSLPNILKQKGYQTSFFHGASNGSMGFQSFCNLVGIQNYYGKTEYNNDSDYDNFWGIWDEPFLQFTANQISKQQQPFFSTIFTLSSHDPFFVPTKYKNKLKKGNHPIFQTLSYTDLAVKKFFENAKKQPWFQNTIFVITGDHTSSFAGASEFANNIGRFKTPIFFYCPKLIKPYKSDRIIQQTDIMPSVLGLLNFNKPVLAFGKNVFDLKSRNFAINYFGNYQWYSGNYVLLFDDAKPSRLFNFVSDKLLQNDVAIKLPKIKLKMENELKAFIQHYQNRMIDNQLIIK